MESGRSLYYVISEQRKCYLHIVGFGKNFFIFKTFGTRSTSRSSGASISTLELYAA